MSENYFKILFCGDRNYRNKNAIWNVMRDLIEEFGKFTAIHGDARGADKLSGEVAEEFNLKVEKYPADWNKYGKFAGPIRNREMLDQRPDLVIAFHPFISNSKGTKDCISEARKRKIEVRLFK